MMRNSISLVNVRLDDQCWQRQLDLKSAHGVSKLSVLVGVFPPRWSQAARSPEGVKLNGRREGFPEGGTHWELGGMISSRSSTTLG